MTTRAQAEMMALRFLAEQGPHQIPNPLDTEEAICACLIFHDLDKRGLVNRKDHGGGDVEFSIAGPGLARLRAS